MSKKKVIFVAGAQYSGTTLLDAIIANDDHGFSCGEVNAYFHPYRPHHYEPDCGCANPDCDIWANVKKKGEKNLYLSIFDQFPEVEFIVDSSKEVLWIVEQTKNLKKQNIEVQNILIWKTPEEIAHSFNKRDAIDDWERSWVNYYRMYSTLIDQWASIRYADFVKSPDCLHDICNYLDIPYYEAKKEYWNRQYHTLFGNTSTKIHMYSNNEEAFEKAQKELLNDASASEDKIEEKLKSIYYEKNLSDKFPVKSQQMVDAVTSILDQSDLKNASNLDVDKQLLDYAAFNKVELGMRYLKHGTTGSKIQSAINKRLQK